MKTKFFLIILLAIIFGASLFFFRRQSSLVQTELTPIRIGWQVPWATQGQLAQILNQTDILNKNGLKGNFKGFESGAPLNEAALADEVDVIFTADQPAATLLSKNDNWVIISRLMYNRVAVYVPPNSPIHTPIDLKGKTVGMPFGASAQRLAYKIQTDAGLTPGKDVNNVNLGIYEHSALITDKEAEKWGSIDAVAGFDPTAAVLEIKGLTRNLAEGKVVSVIIMSKSYIKENPEAPSKFLRAFSEAYNYYKKNTGQADQWFTEGSKLTIPAEALALSASIEPNLKKDIYLNFTDEDYRLLQEAADFLYTTKLIKTKVNMKQHINLQYLEQSQ